VSEYTIQVISEAETEPAVTVHHDQQNAMRTSDCGSVVSGRSVGWKDGKWKMTYNNIQIKLRK